LEIIEDDEISKDDNENPPQPTMSDSPFREQISADFMPVNNALGN